MDTKKAETIEGKEPTARPASPGSFVEGLPIDLIEFSPDNVRRAHNKDADADLAADVKAHGVLEPVLVRPHPKKPGRYDLRAGERRVRACQAAGLETVPALVREMDDAEALRVTVIENLQREDLTPMESALALERLHKHGWDDDAIGAEIGKSPGWVARRRALNKLTPGWQKTLLDGQRGNVGEWPAAHLELIARLPEATQDAVLRQFRREWHWEDNRGMPTRAKIEHEIDQYLRKTGSAKWALEDADLLPEAGACAACVKRSGAQPRLFEDLGTSAKEDRCLDGQCWEKKAAAFVRRRAAELQEEHGKELLLVEDGSYGEKSPVKGEVVNQYSISDCKPGTPGARPCLRVTGPHAGQVGWAISRRAESGRRTGRMAGPKSLDERRTALEGKRAKRVIAAVKAKLDQDTELREWEDLGLLAAAFGAGYPLREQAGEFESWKAYDRLSKKPEAGRRALWDRIKTNLRHQFQYYDLQGAARCLEDAERICRYLGGDWKALWAEVCAAIPEPKAWATLNEDGTPKTPARPKRKAGAAPSKDTTGSATKKSAKPKAGVCRKCGCTESTPCLVGGEPCAWADSTKTLCTACAPGGEVHEQPVRKKSQRRRSRAVAA